MIVGVALFLAGFGVTNNAVADDVFKLFDANVAGVGASRERRDILGANGKIFLILAEQWQVDKRAGDDDFYLRMGLVEGGKFFQPRLGLGEVKVLFPVGN